MNPIKFLFYRPLWQRLPPIPRQYTTDFDAKDVTEDVAQLMCRTHTRSPHGVELLMQRHAALSPRALVEMLPRRRRRRNIGGRFEQIVMRVLGVTPYDPMRKIAHEHMRRGQR